MRVGGIDLDPITEPFRQFCDHPAARLGMGLVMGLPAVAMAFMGVVGSGGAMVAFGAGVMRGDLSADDAWALAAILLVMGSAALGVFGVLIRLVLPFAALEARPRWHTVVLSMLMPAALLFGVTALVIPFALLMGAIPMLCLMGTLPRSAPRSADTIM